MAEAQRDSKDEMKEIRREQRETSTVIQGRLELLNLQVSDLNELKERVARMEGPFNRMLNRQNRFIAITVAAVTVISFVWAAIGEIVQTAIGKWLGIR